MNFIKLLELYGFDRQKAGRVYIVRHALDRPELIEHITPPAKHFEAWQCLQRQKNPPKKGKSKPTHNMGAGFWKCDTFVSFCSPEFYGEKGGHARFVGVYRNNSGSKPESLNVDKHLKTSPKLAKIYNERKDKDSLYFFNFQRMARFKDLERRVIVKWHNPRGWVQQLKDTNAPEVLEILSKENADRIAKQFPGMGNVRMPFAEMAQMVNSPIVYSVWHGALKSSKGVYLITEKDTGKMYVGAAYGDEGILGRWKTYAETPDGYNEGLKERLAEKEDAHLQFQFSILQQLPITANEDEVRKCEREWKKKLLTHEFGYNHNL